MPYGNSNSTDAWLARNWQKAEAAQLETLLSSPAKNVRQRVLPLVLAIAALVVAVTWYNEVNTGLLNAVDRIGYPALLVVTSVGSLLLLMRPDSLNKVMVTVFITYITHLLGVYYLFMINRLVYGASSNYELINLTLWLPFSYVACFVFFSPRAALITSFGIFTAIALPILVLLGIEADTVVRETAIAVLIAQPIYIAALWGVGLLKTHASGIHDYAKTMRMAANIDPLTGIANRRAILHAMETVTGGTSASDRTISLLLLDVDHFKEINDTFGHAVGDEVLISLASRVTAQLRSSDLLGRWGGEEFILLTLDQSDSQALQMAERLRAALVETVFPHKKAVTVSIGVSSYIPSERVDSFIKRADDALYRAKELGRNRVEGVFAI